MLTIRQQALSQSKLVAQSTRLYSSKAQSKEPPGKIQAIIDKSLDILTRRDGRKKRSTKLRKGGYHYQEPTAIYTRVAPKDIDYVPITLPDQDPIPQLQHKLSRVLFSPGVHYLQDPRTKVFNFNPHLQNILPVEEFNFDSITTFVTASKDQILSRLAREHELKYYASTSSMTGILSHFHFLLSNFRPASLKDMSRHQPDMLGTPRPGAMLPSSVILRHTGAGLYAIDSDKSADREMVLSLLGHSLERFLTKTPEEYEEYKVSKGNTEIVEANTYHYAKMGDFLLRSQLDCYDPRLPGTGTFDLKTRAVAAVRYDLAHVEKNMTGYEIVRTLGRFESFERELLDLARSTLLKYSLQARIGNMDGIFIAYHNIVKMFGFQYLPLSKIDHILHSYRRSRQDEKEMDDPVKAVKIAENEEKVACKHADEEFKLSMKMWNLILNDILKHHVPHNGHFRVVMAATPVTSYETKLQIVVSQLTDENITHIQSSGERLQKLLTEATDDEHQLILEKHIESIKSYNTEIKGQPVAFEVFVESRFNGSPTTQKHPTLMNMDSEWTVKTKVVQVDAAKSADLYDRLLEKKISTLGLSASLKGDDEVSTMVKLLRAFGRRGEKLKKTEAEQSRKIVWNDE